MAHVQHAFPILYFNLGGELMYIIEQRLQAQNIPEEKSIRGKLSKNKLIFWSLANAICFCCCC